jgi:hypothetical protein
LKSDESSLEDVAHRFHTTRWTALLLSGQSQAPGFQAALGELYQIYWYPLYAYIRRRAKPAEIEDELRALCNALTTSEGRLGL